MTFGFPFTPQPNRKKKSIHPWHILFFRFVWFTGWLGFFLVLFTGCGGNVGNKKFYEGEGGVQGYLFDTDGKTVSQALVLVVDYPHLKVSSGANGYFELSGIPSGRRDILLDNQQGLAARITVWIVKDRITEIPASQSTLLPAATLSGRIVAPPRLHDKDIAVSLTGTHYKTTTYNESGYFRFEQIAAGCHSLFAETPLFSSQTIDVVCVKPGEHRTLERPLQLYPTTPCQVHKDCFPSSICQQNSCVPQGQGIPKPLVSTIVFATTPFEQSSTQSIAVIQNTGYGDLVIRQISIEGENDIFTIEPKSIPQLPHSLAINQSLYLTLTFHARQIKEHRAFLVISANNTENPAIKIPLQGTVETQEKDCLVFEPQSISLPTGSLRQIPITVQIFNRCGQPIAVNPPLSQSTPPQGTNEPSQTECGQKTWGHFNIPTCQSSSLPNAIPIAPGEKRRWIWDLQVFGYGLLEGSLSFSYVERYQGQEFAKTINIPVQGHITLSGVTVSPSALDFGSIATGQTIPLWIGLQFSAVTNLESLDAQFVSPSSPFQTTTTRWSRHVPESNIHYLKLQYTAPTVKDLYQNTLILKNHPSFQGLPYYVPVRGTVATPQTPILKPIHDLGHTESCQPPSTSVFITNPGDKPITVQEITLTSVEPNDFVIKQGKFPFTLPALTTTELAQIQWNKPENLQSIRAVGLFQVKTRQNDRYTILTSQLEAQKGFPYVETHYQPSHRRIHVMLFVDPKNEQNDFTTGLIDLIRKMQTEQLLFSLYNIASPWELPPITQNTASPETELQQWLQSIPTNSIHHGVESLQTTRKKLSLPDPTSTTIALIYAEHDDFSPYSVESYIPSSGTGTPASFHTFAAIPFQACRQMTKSFRYLDLVSLTGGIATDLCQTNSAAWKFWFEQIEDTILQRRKRFPLRYRPEESSIKVKIDGVSQQNEDPPRLQKWRYDANTNQIVLLETVVPPGKKIEISYHTACQ